MVKSGYFVSQYIDVGEGSVQPNGVDLSVDSIFQFDPWDEGVIFGDGVFIPDRELVSDVNGLYSLEKGTYIVQYNEKVEIPEDCIGLVLPRSSLMRCGSNIDTAVWDSGYNGIGLGRLDVGNRIQIERGARVAQMIFIEANSHKSYDGKYQGENL